jgi:hypothetical protein
MAFQLANTLWNSLKGRPVLVWYSYFDDVTIFPMEEFHFLFLLL